jgi:photoactive yellow protein
MASVDVGSLGRMTPDQLDGLPFGVVTLDSNGRVIGYNDTESRLAGLPKDRVIGRNFFTEVAPCTRVREFEGRFRDFAEGRSRLALETFEFVFHFRHGAQRVVILISPARHRGRFHVSMIRR